jgi:hypothetical protein
VSRELVGLCASFALGEADMITHQGCVQLHTFFFNAMVDFKCFQGRQEFMIKNKKRVLCNNSDSISALNSDP